MMAGNEDPGTSQHDLLRDLVPVDDRDEQLSPVPVQSEGAATTGFPPDAPGVAHQQEFAAPTQQPEPAPSAAPGVVPDVRDVAAELVLLRAAIDQLYTQSERQATLVDRLHEENERLRRGAFEQIVDPLVRDLIALADSCLRNASAWRGKTEVTPTDLDRVLRDIASDLSMILDRQGVEIFAPEPGLPFDRRQHRAARVQPTEVAPHDGLVAETLRPGYRSGIRILRYAEVVVYGLVAAP
ncbi:nucleotide exchange factor GrpE [Frankia sp. AgKG'84/4]|uniref:nucleotide exchange factor GrpE n=1 Tax=Frankia sp. AgKG'84/4 TaxID=573490 RepID=UPI00200CF951|nr:nucleotide exchange factor GrpE [Frankia sp. AgKG'84/4]MCL9793083.1 nucleotide exchange factor GrpE [Frankia sp. AgKG'84/4]